MEQPLHFILGQPITQEREPRSERVEVDATLAAEFPPFTNRL